MVLKNKVVIHTRMVVIASLCSLNVALAEELVTEKDTAIKTPSTTLAAAAKAANAAVSAAAAAAAAASAASAASAAAVEAINAVLPPSQRVTLSNSTTAATTDNSVQADMISTSTDVANIESDVKTFPIDDAVMSQSDATAEDFENRFLTPTEHSLVGLIGTFEVLVSADARGDYTSGILAQNYEPVESISGINLSEAIQRSLGFSRDVHVAFSRVDQAKAQTGQAKAFLLPSLFLNMKAGQERSSPGVNIDSSTGDPEAVSTHGRSDASLTFKQPLFDLPSWYDWKRRKVIEGSRQESVRSSQGDAYLETVNAYLSLVSSRIQANMASDYEKQLDELFNYIDKREAAGVATHSDKERVRARSLNAQSSRIQQEAAQAAAGVEFVRIVNVAPDSMRLPDLEDLGLSIVPNDVQEAMSLAVASNPDIALLQEELKAARMDQDAVKGRYLPRFDLEVSHNRSNHAGGSDDSQRDQRAMVVMNWSLFNGGSDLKLKDEKTARTTEINFKLDDQRRRVLQSVSAQYATLEGVRQRLNTGYSELESIASAAKSMSNRMVSGKQSLLDMLDVYNRYFQARTHLVNLHTQEMSAVAQIVRLIQGVPMTDYSVVMADDFMSTAADDAATIAAESNDMTVEQYFSGLNEELN